MVGPSTHFTGEKTEAQRGIVVCPRSHSYLRAGRPVSPALEGAPWKTEKSPAFRLISPATWKNPPPAPCAQTLVPGHLQKLGHLVSPEIQREEGQGKGCKAKDWGRMEDLAEVKAKHLAIYVAKVLARRKKKKVQLVSPDKFLQLKLEDPPPPNSFDFGKPD